MKNFALLITYFVAVAFLFMTLCMNACSAPRVVTVTEYRDRVQRDTITQVDSVYISHVVREKGDTVHILDTIFKYKYLDKYAYVHVHDSIPYEVEVKVPVRTRNGYDRFTSLGFWILLLLLLLRVAWWVFRKFYLRQ